MITYYVSRSSGGLCHRVGSSALGAGQTSTTTTSQHRNHRRWWPEIALKETAQGVTCQAGSIHKLWPVQ